MSMIDLCSILIKAVRYDILKVKGSNQLGELCLLITFDTLERLYKIEAEDTGRTRLYKRASQEFYGITEKICGIFMKTCPVCYL